MADKIGTDEYGEILIYQTDDVQTNIKVKMENSIEIKELNKFYGKKKQALSNVNLTIEQGFGLLGRNDAGKTTLMKTLATLLQK